MREKLATLPLAELRELAKAQGIKGVAGLRKSELIDRLCEIAQEKPEETGRSAAAEGGQAAETRSAVEPRVGAESRAGAESRGEQRPVAEQISAETARTVTRRRRMAWAKPAEPTIPTTVSTASPIPSRI